MGDITMPGFIRVRATDGVRHEFHAPADWVAAHPEFYVVLDPEPVSKPAPVKYVKTKPRKPGVGIVAQVDGYVAGIEKAHRKTETENDGEAID